MLLLVAKWAHDEFNKQKEGFSSADQKMTVSVMKIIGTLVGILIALLLPVWAAGTSWHCNSIRGSGFPAKLWYGFWAQVFAPLYLLLRAIRPRWCPTRLM
jgi:hypothetical protein